MSSIPALILAGGLARRMGGGDKARRPLAGRPVLDHILARLAPQAAPVLLNVNGDPARFAGYGLEILPDPVAGHPGPLAGVLAGLEWARTAGHDWILTVPGDAPFLPLDLASRLREACAAAGAMLACASSGGRTHPVAAIWSAALAQPLRGALDAGRFKVGGFTAEQGAAVADWPVDPADPFMNINTPDDLMAAERLSARLDIR